MRNIISNHNNKKYNNRPHPNYCIFFGDYIFLGDYNFYLNNLSKLKGY